MPTKSALASALANLKPGRSAWSRAVHRYAVELIESIDDSADLSNERLLEKALLSGADDWQQYSEGLSSPVDCEAEASFCHSCDAPGELAGDMLLFRFRLAL